MRNIGDQLFTVPFILLLHFNRLLKPRSHLLKSQPQLSKLIDRMLQTDSVKTLAIVKVMDNTARTKILTIMAQDQTLLESAALILNVL